MRATTTKNRAHWQRSLTPIVGEEARTEFFASRAEVETDVLESSQLQCDGTMRAETTRSGVLLAANKHTAPLG